jgi:hypothetical protein
MKTLQNFARPLTVYVGDFADDSVKADFQASHIFNCSYTDFMASFYQFCNAIDTNQGIVFTMSESGLESALKDYRDISNEEYNLIKYDL